MCRYVYLIKFTKNNINMDRSYIESDKWEKNVGEWILFFNLLMLFTLLLLELYNSFFGQEKSLYLFYRDFQNIGLTVGLIFIGLFLFLITKSIIKRLFKIGQELN